jgi:hypothetical protein
MENPEVPEARPRPPLRSRLGEEERSLIGGLKLMLRLLCVHQDGLRARKACATT